MIAAFLSGYCDSNTGPSGPKPDALANCATPRLLVSLSFGIAKIDTKIKSAKLFQKKLHFFIFQSGRPCIFPDRCPIFQSASGKNHQIPDRQFTNRRKKDRTHKNPSEQSPKGLYERINRLEVWIEGLPLRYWWDDAERDDLVTHNLEVCVRCIESCELLRSSCNLSEVNACCVDHCRHSHEDILILLSVHIASCWPVEFSTTHCSLNHEN